MPSAPVHPELMQREGSEPPLIISNLTDQFFEAAFSQV